MTCINLAKSLMAPILLLINLPTNLCYLSEQSEAHRRRVGKAHADCADWPPTPERAVAQMHKREFPSIYTVCLTLGKRLPHLCL